MLPLIGMQTQTKNDPAKNGQAKNDQAGPSGVSAKGKGIKKPPSTVPLPEKPPGVPGVPGIPGTPEGSEPMEESVVAEPQPPGPMSDDDDGFEQIGGLEPVEKLSVRFPGMLCRRFHDDRVAAAVVCFTKQWDRWISDSQLLAPEQEMAVRMGQSHEPPLPEREIRTNHFQEWIKYVFGMVMFAEAGDLVDIAFPDVSFRAREDAARMFERNIVAMVTTGGVKCRFEALLSSGVDFPSTGFESDLSMRFFGVKDLTPHITGKLYDLQKAQNDAKLRRIVRTAANSMRVTLNGAMRMQKAHRRPLFRGFSNPVGEYGDAFVGMFDMTSNIRSTSSSFRLAGGFSGAVDGVKFLHIFLIGDPSVRCVSVDGVLSDELS